MYLNKGLKSTYFTCHKIKNDMSNERFKAE